MEFKYKIREILNDHLYKIVFKVAPNTGILQYNNELKKYFDHYFPIKKSGKNIVSNSQKEYLDRYLDEAIIKATIVKMFENATTQFILQKSKIIKHNGNVGLTTNNSSEMLMKIKQKDAFHLQFLNAICFATKNLASIVNYKGSKDILGKDEFKKLEIPSFNGSKIHFFFPELSSLKNNINADNNLNRFIDIISAIRGSIQAPRNNIVHYQKGENVFLVNKYEKFKEVNIIINKKNLEKDRDISFKDNELIEILKKDLENLPKLFAEKMKSGRLFEFYNPDDIINMFQSIDLNPKPLPFIPSFKNVFSYGKKFQTAKPTLNLKNYIIESDDDEAVKAFRFALKQVYEHAFIKQFLKEGNCDFFRCIAKEVIEANIKENTNSNSNSNRFAFREVDKNKLFNKSPEEFLKYIQSAIMNEELKKRDRDMGEKETGYFQKFIWTLFLTGFDRFLDENNKRYGFIKSPKNNDNIDINKKAEEYANNIKITHSIATVDNSTVAFWIFCKILDAVHLNELNNQISKYIQSEVKLKTDTYTKMQEVIQLALLTVDNGFDNNLAIEDIENYIDFVPTGEPYLLSDNKTVVLFNGVIMAEKYATKPIIEKVLAGFKVNNNDITEWKEFTKLKDAKNEISRIQKERSDLHAKWVDSIDSGVKKGNKLSYDVIKYKTLAEKIDRYNWLDNKINLVHVKQLHNILIEILGRLVGFIAIFERDSLYLKNDCKNKQLIQNGDNFRNKRNYIAHFNYISMNAGKSILELLADTRQIVSYDRKLKNAVIKSFIDIFDRHNIAIKLSINHDDNEKIDLVSISPKPTKHLKGKVILSGEKEFCAMLEKLIKLKKLSKKMKGGR